MGTALRLELDGDGVASLIFDLPNEKVNTISAEVLEELNDLLEIAKKNSAIKILVIKSNKKDIFIAGADLKGFKPMFKNPELAKNTIYRGHEVFNKIAQLPFPTVALIDGVCLGGGTELALACTYRIVTDHPKTEIGLPEVNLGIFPGWGGTQRLPRLIGIENALNLILTGKSIDAKKAFKLKFADMITAREFLDENLELFLRKCLKNKSEITKKRKIRGLYHFLLEKNPIGRNFLFNQARKNVLEKTNGLYPAPLLALDLIKKTCTKKLNEGLKIEAQTFIKAISNEFKNAINLIDLFFASEEIKKNPGLNAWGNVQPIKSAAVIGAGTMGAGIAWLFTWKDIPVRLKDVNWTFLSKGVSSVYSIYEKMIKIFKVKPHEFQRKFQLLSTSIDYSGFKRINIAIEAATEDLEIKRKIFEELEEVISKDAIIASNTSSLSISEMAKNLKNPERFVGMHFFNPPNRMPLVEVVAGERTSLDTLTTAVDLCKKFGKVPLIVKDCPGFLVNRIFALAANEASWMLQEGISIERLDRVLTEFGMPMGPCQLADEVGNDIAFKVFSSLYNAYGERMHPPELAYEMVNAGLLGKKIGKGFFIYKGKNKIENPEIEKLVRKINNRKRSMSDQEIVDRFTLGMINEAARCLDEGVVDSPLYVDMGLLYGIGFPPFHFGLLRYADNLGIDNIVKKLNRFAQVYGERFIPCPSLLTIESFYSEDFRKKNCKEDFIAYSINA